MLSICIPIYNFDVRPMVQKLHEQIGGLNFAAEIICIDDHSAETFDVLNREIEPLVAHYVRLDENVGRARIRNLFLDYAHYEYMLFLDCDSLIEKSHFLSRYADVLAVKPLVVCGGRSYPKVTDRGHRLRYIYGIRCESKDAQYRQLRPNKSFMTNNFIIKRSLLNSVRFDERLSLYGHEDTLFGYELNEQRITILHIQNPVVNGDVESNEEYLRKTKESIRNLVSIYEWKGKEKSFYRSVSLLHAYDRLRRLGMVAPVRVVFKMMEPILEHSFMRGCADMVWFKFYKLGLFISYQHQHKNLVDKPRAEIRSARSRVEARKGLVK